MKPLLLLLLSKPAFTFSELKEIVAGRLTQATIINPSDAKRMARPQLPCPGTDPPHCYLAENHLETSPPIHKNMAEVVLPVAGLGMEIGLIFFESKGCPSAFCDGCQWLSGDL